MDPTAQSTPCDMAQRLIQMDTEWTLKLSHIDILAGVSQPQMIVGKDANRVKLTICNRTPDQILELGQFSTAALFVGIPLYAHNVVFGVQYEGVYILERNVEDDKAECTGAWYAEGTVGCCMYVSEVIYTGNARRCKPVIEVDECCNPCCPDPKESNNGSETSNRDSGFNAFRAESSSD